MTVHPQIAAILERRRAAGALPYSSGTAEQARRTYAASQAAMPSGRGGQVHAIVDETIAGVPVRRYRPAHPTTAAIVYCHGGGWVVGTLDGFDAACRALCRATGAEVVSVDYRLAPDHPFPAALDDVQTVLRAIAAEAPTRRLVVMGDSAGGNLAAASAVRANAVGSPRIDLQVLAYPITDSDFERPSYARYGGGDFLLTTGDMEWFWDAYAPAGVDRTDPCLSPLNAKSLAGLPPAIVIIAGCDPLRDEGVAYAEALQTAGVETDLRIYDDMIHGFLTLTGVLDTADTAMVETGRAIMERLPLHDAASSSA